MNIYQLKIKINTKIPKYLQIELTSDILVHDVKTPLLKYPLFIDNKPYPKKRLQNYTYNEIVAFFFNNKTFTNIMKNVNAKPNNKTNRMLVKNIKQNITRKNVNINVEEVDTNITAHENFTIMLQLLFPTTFPLVNNVETSLSYLLTDKTETIPFIKPEQNNKLNPKKFFSFKGANIALFNFLPRKFNRNYSYLKIENSIYTITQVIWINDVMNHPIYKDILLKYHIFEQWKNKYEPTIDTKDQEMQLEIIRFINRIMLKKNNGLILLDVINGLTNNTGKDGEGRKYDRRDKNEILIQRIVNALTSLEKIRIENGNVDNSFKQNTVEINKSIVKEFIVVINIFESLNDRALFSGSYENLDNIRRKIKEYELTRDINDYILDLNFEYLNEESKNTRSGEIINRINTLFPEFNNFVKVIRDMKSRVVYNPVWKNTITKIIRGEKDHNFEDLWHEINNCYSITDLGSLDDKKAVKKEDADKKEKEDIEDKRKNAKILYDNNQKLKLKQNGGEKTNKCKNINYELNVGFDIVNATSSSSDNPNNNDVKTAPNLKTIEVYLQMNIIEGKITNQNMKVLNCPYNDEFLGNMYENLLYNSKEQWNVTEQLVFFDGKALLEAKDKQNAEKKRLKP